jgi:hypothetical protein
MSLPTAETEGLHAGESTVSVGALPGSANETDVAVLPEEAALGVSHTGTAPSTGASPDHHRSTEIAVLGTGAIATGVLAERHHEQATGPGRGRHRLGHQAGAVRGAVGRPRALDARQRRGRGVRAPPPRLSPARSTTATKRAPRSATRTRTRRSARARPTTRSLRSRTNARTTIAASSRRPSAPARPSARRRRTGTTTRPTVSRVPLQ